MVTLREKFRGCIAGSWVGSAMGAAVEGWSREKIARTHGFLDRLLPYKHYTSAEVSEGTSSPRAPSEPKVDWLREPGTTEDGIERQKLIATAIIEKRDRIQAHDLVAVWLRDLEAGKMRFKQERFDRSLLELARAGVPPSELGRLWPFPNLVSMARASHPLGLINAGDPASAAADSYEVGRVYAGETAFALRWAALYNAAVAEACRPEATVESVLATARRFARYRAEAGSLYAHYDTIEKELARALELAQAHGDPMAMRDAFYELYDGGSYLTYGQSQANEIVCKGLAVFALCRGDPRQAILTAVNFGRDTDCLAAVAGGLAGTLRGQGQVPAEWIEQVDRATAADPYTNNKRTIAQTADGLFEAFKARIARSGQYARAMSDPEYLG